MKDNIDSDLGLDEDNNFEVINYTSFESFKNGTRKRIPESDLCLNFPEGVVQLKFHEKKVTKTIVKPGVFAMIDSAGNTKLEPIDLKFDKLLDSVDNTTKIMKEAEMFYKNLSTYDDLGIQKKRAILLYGPPGTGKSSSISRVIGKLRVEDEGTVAIVWNTSQVRADSVYNFINFSLSYERKCTRLVLVIEDIGGEEDNGPNENSVPSGLLNLLDGVDMTFKLPTFIVSTTNYPHTLLETLVDRPGRFDKMIKLGYPMPDERVALAEFFTKRPLTKEENDLFRNKKTENFSVAHIKESVLRSKISDQTVEQVVDDMYNHKELIKNDFQKPKSIRI
jgi:SpoVK/Ycf46/Vps4 family AAA+-type ATPase